MKARNITVYAVEDSPIIRNLLIELIDAAGATVVGYADTASAAIADIAALRPDVVTIDLLLKAGSGFDVLKAIATSEGTPPLRIVLTNYLTDAHREAARGMDADYFFDKATQIREMLLVLASLSETQRVIAA
jgi:DNA-binding NarL/FixJ family response regulator